MVYFFQKSVIGTSSKLFFAMELHFISENCKFLERISLFRRKGFYFSFHFYIYPPDLQEETEVLYIAVACGQGMQVMHCMTKFLEIA